jgi:chromosome segregation ATPase
MITSLSQIISEKESELARFRQAAADAARRKEDEVRGHMLEVLESMEMEMERTRQESERVIKAAIQQAECDASASIGRAKLEMNDQLRQREDEIFAAAGSKIEEDWTAREDHLRGEFMAVLSSELENQHSNLTSCWTIAMKADEEEMKRRIHEIEEEHRSKVGEMHQKMEEVADEIWNEACTKFGAAAESRIAHSVAIADAECSARDEQISTLLEERAVLQKLLSEKEILHEKISRDSTEMEKASSDRGKRHDKEISDIIEEARNLAIDHDQMKKSRQQMESKNDLLRSELSKSKMENKALQSKHREQREKINRFDCEKQRYESRIGELSACKQLLDRQLEDLKEGNKELTTVSEGQNKRIEELVRSNEKSSDKLSVLTNHVGELQQKNHDLEKRHNAAIAQISSLEQERREYARLIEDGMKQNSRLLVEALEKNGPTSRSEPVVVHLHGNNGDNANMNERLSSECNTLRSKMIQLERENFHLEGELMNTKNGEQVHQKDSKNHSCGVGMEVESENDLLRIENNSLRTILSMMRKEMETAGETKDPDDGPAISSMPSESTLETQLFQCRSYLDMLLKTRDPNDGHGRGFASDEVAFLRSKYRDLHREADELREENQRLHRMCNGGSGDKYNDEPTGREKELIQKLEEATDEIEALLKENEKLARVSNDLRFELDGTRGGRRSSSGIDPPRRIPPSTRGDGVTVEHERRMLDAIMNDQSRSCGSSPSSARKDTLVSEVVACIGRKPPMTNAAESRPSKTAYVRTMPLPFISVSPRAPYSYSCGLTILYLMLARAQKAFRPRTASDIERKKKEINRKKKEIAVEKARIRNWNVKDRTTNPYL